MAEKKEKRSSSSRDLSTGGFLIRLAAALILVLATYNPTDWSYVDWVQAGMANGTLGPEHLFVGIVVLIGWTIYGAASIRSLGILGLVLGVAFFAALVWLLIDLGILSATSTDSVIWITQVCLAALLAIGVSWSHIWRRVTGQLEVDED